MFNKTEVDRFAEIVRLERAGGEPTSLFGLAQRNADKLPLSQISQEFLKKISQNPSISQSSLESEVRSLFHKLEKSAIGGSDSLSVSRDRSALFYLSQANGDKLLSAALVSIGKVTPSEALPAIIALGQRHDSNKIPPQYPESLMALKQGYREPVGEFVARMFKEPGGMNSNEKFLYDISTRNLPDIRKQNYTGMDGFSELVAALVDHVNSPGSLPQHKEALSTLLDARQIPHELVDKICSNLKSTESVAFFKGFSAGKIPPPIDKGLEGSRPNISGRSFGG